MKKIFAVFNPYTVVSKTNVLIIVSAQLALLLLYWMSGTSALIPTPVEVLKAFARLWTQEALGRQLFSSAGTFLQAMGLAIAISLSLAYLTVVPVFRPITGLVTKLRFLGLAGLTFLFTLVFPSAHALKVALLTFGISVFLTTSVEGVVSAVTREELDHARTLRMGEWRVVWEVVILGKLAETIKAILQNQAIGWAMLTMVEGVVRGEGGIGVLLLNQNKHLLLAEVFAIQIAFLITGLAIDYSGSVLKNMVCPYASLTLERK